MVADTPNTLVTIPKEIRDLILANLLPKSAVQIELKTVRVRRHPAQHKPGNASQNKADCSEYRTYLRIDADESKWLNTNSELAAFNAALSVVHVCKQLRIDLWRQLWESVTVVNVDAEKALLLRNMFEPQSCPVKRLLITDRSLIADIERPTTFRKALVKITNTMKDLEVVTVHYSPHSRLTDSGMGRLATDFDSSNLTHIYVVPSPRSPRHFRRVQLTIDGVAAPDDMQKYEPSSEDVAEL
ncbi:uncharacterized protein AB675_11834 [Cyphellophora attinorum]|uniref:Uncharacterized protein n=1 Tax=Cyphellophora attinorum TaxID=1664694 RepID=A0A0N1NYZ9_9EURO|nr:uncharacterized protein AB675_11834 [Phialophora attinorum]KPI36836.1 hypothetical protein AB675_11834 [Phialophora attinorum]